jgi:hydroxyacid-oxoacid transhydrogenase
VGNILVTAMKSAPVFEMAASSVRYGVGVTGEVGMDLADMGIRRVLVVADPALANRSSGIFLPPLQAVVDSLDQNGIVASIYDRVRIEPSDTSWADAIAFAREWPFDALIAVGGGSTIDTAKAVNLYTTYPPDAFLDYVNAPVGKSLAVPGPLKPLLAIPTTAGTGSETTGVAIMDISRLHLKTGISSRRLKPTLAYLDPDNTRTMPPEVAASSGLDILCHAIESFTALPFTERPASERPSLRPPYNGANPISDIWSLQALRMVAKYLIRAVEDPSDDEARASMILAASYAGLGFGNAGVHLPHAMSYPVAGHVTSYRPEGWDADHPLVPHGVSVILNAPAVFRFTAAANPERHLQAAALLGANTARTQASDAGRILADRITWFMQQLNVPNGLQAIGYSSSDIPALVEGTLMQKRLTMLAPRTAEADELSAMFEEALVAW